MRRAIIALTLLLAGCSSGPSRTVPLPSPTPGAINTAPPPGVYNPNVTQANISSTICVVGWTATVRPPQSYTSALKRQQIAARHLADTNPADYEEDHFIPLELGGAPSDPNNLWPQPHTTSVGKDAAENRLHAAVCHGRMRLDAARSAITDPANWHK